MDIFDHRIASSTSTNTSHGTAGLSFFVTKIWKFPQKLTKNLYVFFQKMVFEEVFLLERRCFKGFEGLWLASLMATPLKPKKSRAARSTWALLSTVKTCKQGKRWGGLQRGRSKPLKYPNEFTKRALNKWSSSPKRCYPMNPQNQKTLNRSSSSLKKIIKGFWLRGLSTKLALPARWHGFRGTLSPESLASYHLPQAARHHRTFQPTPRTLKNGISAIASQTYHQHILCSATVRHQWLQHYFGIGQQIGKAWAAAEGKIFSWRCPY